MTSKLTREENVQAVFDLKSGYTLGLADVEILKRVARMALAAIDSKPVAYMYRDNLHSDARFSLESKIGNWSPEDINEYEISETPLYRHAQPAPVVPVVPEKTPDSVYQVIYQECGGFVDCDANAQTIWDACRAAMLSGGKS